VAPAPEWCVTPHAACSLRCRRAAGGDSELTTDAGGRRRASGGAGSSLRATRQAHSDERKPACGSAVRGAASATSATLNQKGRRHDSQRAPAPRNACAACAVQLRLRRLQCVAHNPSRRSMEAPAVTRTRAAATAHRGSCAHTQRRRRHGRTAVRALVARNKAHSTAQDEERGRGACWGHEGVRA
jgi:hypothetical protein